MRYDDYTDLIKLQIEENIKQLNYIIKNSIKKSISDYEEPYQFLKSEYPKVNIDNIPVYESKKTIVNASGLKYAAGVYFPYARTVVLIRQKDLNSTAFSGELTNKFDKLLFKKTMNNNLNINEVAIHEFLHAVSHKVRPVGSSFRSHEEQFVYTSSVKYLRNISMLTDEEIIQGHFLPNCINDIMSSKESLDEVVGVVCKNSKYKKLSFVDMQDEIPEILVDAIIEKATEVAKSMIDYYDKYGMKNLVENTKNINMNRSSLINFE